MKRFQDWKRKVLQNPEVLKEYLRLGDEEIESLKSALAERESDRDYWKNRHDVLAPLWAENAAENVLLKETISEYSAGWEKMQGGIKMMSSFAGNVRPEEGCRLVCVRAKELLAIEQPSVLKAGDESIRKGEYERGYQDGAYQVVQDMGRNIKDPEPQSNREDGK